jgi:tRNA-dihydrouridine synthase B
MEILPAPLAGYTDYAFRKLLTECGAAEVWTEMISATALVKNNPKTLNMIKTVSGVRNTVQLFGTNPEHFAAAVECGILHKFDEININMGCPAPKIAKDGGGCCLMRNLALARKIITASAKAVKKQKKPQTLSVKFRLGWNKNIAVHFAQMCEECGADRLIVHGRKGVDGYSGAADFNAIAETVRAVTIPVIANGDITDIKTAEKCMEITNAAGVMIGRGLLGHPWHIKLAEPEPSPAVIRKIISRHIELFEGENYPFPEFKKHALFYCNALHTGKPVKQSVAVAADMAEIKRLLSIEK